MTVRPDAAVAERCADMDPGDGPELLRCTNDGVHKMFIDGCGCVDFEDGFCEKGFDFWECDGPHNYGPIGETKEENDGQPAGETARRHAGELPPA